jgi:hypothetical protein
MSEKSKGGAGNKGKADSSGRGTADARAGGVAQQAQSFSLRVLVPHPEVQHSAHSVSTSTMVTILAYVPGATRCHGRPVGRTSAISWTSSCSG